MAKEGMRQKVYKHPDPTYAAVLSAWKREEKAAREAQRAMMPAKVMGVVRRLISLSGYKLVGDLAIQDPETGNIYRSVTAKR